MSLDAEGKIVPTEEGKRDVSKHVLFEVATEVANRGQLQAVLKSLSPSRSQLTCLRAL